MENSRERGLRRIGVITTALAATGVAGTIGVALIAHADSTKTTGSTSSTSGSSAGYGSTAGGFGSSSSGSGGLVFGGGGGGHAVSGGS